MDQAGRGGNGQIPIKNEHDADTDDDEIMKSMDRRRDPVSSGAAVKREEDCYEGDTEDESDDKKSVRDEDLFKQPPPRDKCRACSLPLPLRTPEYMYNVCCGEVICEGCDDRTTKICPLCGTPLCSPYDLPERLTARVEQHNDAEAMNSLAHAYANGKYGLPQNHRKAIELYVRSGKLGCADSYFRLGSAYYNGKVGVVKDIEKALHYYKLGAVAGEHRARHDLGMHEGNTGNGKMAVKHFMISACVGDDDSVKAMHIAHSLGHATKDELLHACRSHSVAKDTMKSDQRDEAMRDRNKLMTYEEFMGSDAGSLLITTYLERG